jgi:hypothetical protein
MPGSCGPQDQAFFDAILSRIANGNWLIDKPEIRRTTAVPSAGVNWDSFLGFIMIWMSFGLFEVLIAIRIWLMFIGVNPETPIVSI